MVTTFYPPYHFGGEAVFVQQLCNELASQGHEVHVIHCRDSFNLSGRSPKTLAPDHPGVTVHPLQSPWKWLSPLFTQQTGMMGFKKHAIEKIIRDGEFDVIHYHNISLIGLDVLNTGTAIKLYTLHDYWLICPTHVMFKYQRKACIKPDCFSCQLSYSRPPQLWRHSSSISSALNSVDAILAGSRFASKLHEERGLKIRVETLPMFSQLADSAKHHEKAHEKKSPLEHEKNYFLFVGRLEKLKGLQDVLPYFQSNTGATLLIAGEGNFEHALMKYTGDSKNIHFLGQKTAPQLRELYKNAIATIIPSLTYEVSPLVIFESWSEGTPVIVREIGGLGEIVGESGGGVCFSSGEDLAKQLNLLQRDKQLRHQLGDAGHHSYRQNWSAGVHIKRYLDIITRINQAKHGG